MRVNGETRDDVLGKAGISARQLKRWRKEGVAPGPIDRPGRGHARGRAAIYPEGTGELCRAISEKLDEGDVYRLSDAALLLWLEGYPLNDYLREKFVDLLEEGLADIEQQRGEWEAKLDSDDPLSEDHPVRKAQEERPYTGWMNRVLSPGERSTLAYFFMELLAGEPPKEMLNPENGQHDEEGAGPVNKAVRAAVSQLSEPLQHMFTGDPPFSFVEEFLDQYGLPQMREMIRDMSDAEFRALREDTRLVLSRWIPADKSTREAMPDVMGKLLMYRCLDLPIVRITMYLLDHDDPRAQTFGRMIRDHFAK